MRGTVNGILTCARYAFAPNYFHYCGPEKQRDLKEYIQRNTVDFGLSDILHHFETLYPYLLLIAMSNRIKDPFDQRVVEAYWIGNALLGNVKPAAFAAHLSEGLFLKKKIPKKQFTTFMDDVMHGVPNHNEHVCNIFIRTGHATLAHTLATMDSCRISWGQIVNHESGIMNHGQKQHGNNHYIVKTRPLELIDGKLRLGNPTVKAVTSVGILPQKGQYVSLHWGYVCEVLTPSKLRQLQIFTMKALERSRHQERIIQ
jgi:hypothetical protein